MRKSFGDWVPDLPPFKLQQGLTVCENVVPVAAGYAPVSALSNVDTVAASARPKGSLAGRNPDGTPFFIAGTANKLEKKTTSSFANVSNSSGYTSVGTNRWSIVQMGTKVFAANPYNPMQVMDMSSDTTFSDVPQHAPRAKCLEVAENFLWAGDIFSSDLGSLPDAVAWSSLGNGSYWPDPTTDDATAVLSGRQVLEGNGGVVNAIISGREVVAIFQEKAIWRADFVGNDIVWRFNRVESNHGLLIPHAAIDFEGGVLFIAEDGFRIFNYSSSTNIGKEKVNDFFFADYDFDYPDSVSMMKDPQDTKIYVSYSATGNSGVPNRIIVWDYILDQWSLIKPGNHYDLIDASPMPLTLDSPATSDDPDVLGTGNPDTGAPGNQSFDDRPTGDSRESVGAFDSSFRIASFSGTPLEAVLETGDLELTPGRRSLLVSVTPQVDGERPSIQIAGLDKRAEDTTSLDWGIESETQSDGKCYMRVDARFHRLRFNLPTFFTEATDYDLVFRPTGRR